MTVQHGLSVEFTHGASEPSQDGLFHSIWTELLHSMLELSSVARTSS